MILILRNKKIDPIIDKVEDWLRYKKAKFQVLTPESLKLLSFSMKVINDDLQEILTKTSVIWYRRFEIEPSSLGDNEKINHFLKNEFNILREYFFSLFRKDCVWLPNPKLIRLNKLIVLNLCKKIELSIPTTELISSSTELINFKEINSEVITKPLSEVEDISIDNTNYNMFTSEVNNLNTIPDVFFTSIVQKKIKNIYEIRAFYLDGVFYSAGITFNKNEIDFRKFYYDKSFRIFPIELPVEVINKLKYLFEMLSLNTGSVDLILDQKGEYHFLEINPIGQIKMVSDSCHYNLEKKIANKLIDEDK